jgi:hypothetical protein
MSKLVTCDAMYDAMHAALDAAEKAEPSLEFSVTIPVMWAPDSDGWYGPTPDDPLTLYVVADETRQATVSLADEVDEYLSDHTEDGASFREGLSRLSVALRALADKIDAIIKANDVKPL